MAGHTEGASEPDRTPRRPYQKSQRARDEDRTRSRIVDAAEELHGTLGPARTTVSAVAHQAGVTRATVYRHFPTDESLFLACSQQWLSRQQLPDPDAWSRIDDPAHRLRTGLVDIYGYYRRGKGMLHNIYRDIDAVPPAVVAARRAREQQWLDTLLEPLLAQQRPQRTLVRAAVAHATAFATWHSLCELNGLSDQAAADLMVAMVQSSTQ